MHFSRSFCSSCCGCVGIISGNISGVSILLLLVFAAAVPALKRKKENE